jgi:hypothetical protein
MNQSSGTVKGNLKLQSSITWKLIDTGKKNLTFITYSLDPIGLQGLIENLGSNIICCVDLIWK